MIQLGVVTMLLAAVMPTQQPRFDTDTTFAVREGDRLRVKNQGGDIQVRAWGRNAVRVQAEHSRRTDIEVSVSGAVVEIRSHGRMGIPTTADYQLTVPTWMALDLGGLYAQVTVDGTRAPIKVETIEGDITVRGGAESVSLSTINGRIDVSGARGRIDLHTASDDVVGRDLQGDIRVEAISGNVYLRDVDATQLDVQSVSGDLLFTGRIADRGSYSFLTHSGDVTIGIPERTSATLSLATASGDFRFGFPVETERSSRRRQTVRMGSGGASIELETFSGDIRVVRPDDVPPPRVSEQGRRRRPDRDDDHDRDRDRDHHDRDWDRQPNGDLP
jgi:Toastrack DUF4097